MSSIATALAWAYEAPRKLTATERLVLLAMADSASQTLTTSADLQTICSVTERTLESVRTAVDELEGMQVLWDTGKREGATNRVKVFRLTFEETKKSPG